MAFRNEKELKEHFLKCSEKATKYLSGYVSEVIKDNIYEFYKEFKPDMYRRTYQLEDALVVPKEPDKRTNGNGYYNVIWFDEDKVDYSTRLVPYGTHFPEENTLHREPWTKENDEWVVKTALVGELPHGGYAGGGAIWVNSISDLEMNRREIIKAALENSGMPIK